jgi:hypothetical protein
LFEFKALVNDADVNLHVQVLQLLHSMCCPCSGRYTKVELPGHQVTVPSMLRNHPVVCDSQQLLVDSVFPHPRQQVHLSLSSWPR